MIAVIADDLTGAAELAGISLRFGLTVELAIGDVHATGADVLVVSTDSRSLTADQAVTVNRRCSEQLSAMRPSFVFKKIDSVLRGHIVEELVAQMDVFCGTAALVVPANPSMGRTIRDGQYFINDRGIDETGFAGDPEFPVSSSSVVKMLKSQGVFVRKPGEKLPGEGIVVGETANSPDVEKWAAISDEGGHLLAGAGDFYTALLNKRFKERSPEPVQLESPVLYVCGTAYGDSVALVKEISNRTQTVHFIGKEMILQPENEYPGWLSACGETLSRGKLVIAFNPGQVPAEVDPAELRRVMARWAARVVSACTVRELFIEGGATATALLQELGLDHLKPVNELQRGVVRMKSENLFISVKPGSYGMPGQIRQIFLPDPV